MKLLDARTQIREVAARWRDHYLDNGVWASTMRNSDTGTIDVELRALDVETATPQDVAAIIGNDSWCCPQRCDECGDRKWQVVRLGEEPDYESATANICVDCLRKALALAGGAA